MNVSENSRSFGQAPTTSNHERDSLAEEDQSSPLAVHTPCRAGGEEVVPAGDDALMTATSVPFLQRVDLTPPSATASGPSAPRLPRFNFVESPSRSVSGIRQGDVAPPCVLSDLDQDSRWQRGVL